MMRSLYSGVSGLKNHQTRMDVVGNNISNVNTTGFKSSRVTFADTLSQTLSGASSAADGKGGTNPQQIGLGSAVSAIDTLFTNGSVRSTGVNTDLCLSGNGLFIVGKGDSDVYYTRNGNFKFDAKGNYVTSDGLFVKGWIANNGSLNTTSATTYIKIPAGKSMEAKATTQVTYTNNLDASEPMIASIIGKTYSVVQPSAIQATADMNLIITCDDGNEYPVTVGDSPNSYNINDNYTTPGGATVKVQKIQESYLKATATTDNVLTIKLSDGTIQTVTDGSYAVDKSMPITTIVTIYDSLGNTHDVPLYFVKSDINSSTGNTWKLMVNQDGSGTVDIKGKDGKITTVDMPDVEIKFSTDGKFTSGNGTVTLTLNNGATGTQRVAVSLSGLT
ncbi:MAG: flagellar hook-basal body complex protein, partial [Selenomonadaceae bacterium]|nr:flagellar hook-basal body complex protein [Selenomonadaceae bacterium]